LPDPFFWGLKVKQGESGQDKCRRIYFSGDNLIIFFNIAE
jgi:hypothetical protein